MSCACLSSSDPRAYVCSRPGPRASAAADRTREPIRVSERTASRLSSRLGSPVRWSSVHPGALYPSEPQVRRGSRRGVGGFAFGTQVAEARLNGGHTRDHSATLPPTDHSTYVPSNESMPCDLQARTAATARATREHSLPRSHGPKR